jgi:octaprenyl-diphosphate synthase
VPATEVPAILVPESIPAPTAAPLLTRILAPIALDLRAVDALVRERLGTDVALIGTVAEYIIGAGGKRLRPAVLLLTARGLGYEGTNHALLAAVIEFIHTATLLHDDVVDESDLRRGRATANATFGNAASVLVGDFLYSRAFQMMVDAGNLQVLQILADATNRIAEGEVMQLLNIHDPTVDEARYFRVVERKTATLFEAAARIGAVLAGADRAAQEHCARYGAALGTAFQVIDDVLDFDGDPQDIGKRLGDDLREGKATLPLIHALETAAPAERAVVEQAIRTGGGDFAAVATIIHDSGSIAYARGRAEREVAAAQAAAGRLPASPYRDSLLDLMTFSTNRDR